MPVSVQTSELTLEVESVEVRLRAFWPCFFVKKTCPDSKGSRAFGGCERILDDFALLLIVALLWWSFLLVVGA